MVTKPGKKKYNRVCIQSSRTEQASEITMTHQPYIVALDRIGN